MHNAIFFVSDGSGYSSQAATHSCGSRGPGVGKWRSTLVRPVFGAGDCSSSAWSLLSAEAIGISNALMIHVQLKYSVPVCICQY